MIEPDRTAVEHMDAAASLYYADDHEKMAELEAVEHAKALDHCCDHADERDDRIDFQSGA